MTSTVFRSPLAGRHIHRAGWLSLHAPAAVPEQRTATAPPASTDGRLPRTDNVLVVIARPGQESAELGGVLYALRRTGANMSLLTLTRGEASEHNSTCEPLERVRPTELATAAGLLGISSVAVADFPDGKLCSVRQADLVERIYRAIMQLSADMVLMVDPADGPLDDVAVAMAASTAAVRAGLPAVARTASGAHGGWIVDLGDEAEPARAIQRCAVAAHTSQSDALAEQIEGMDVLNCSERLRWLVPPVSKVRPLPT
ncbi:MAG TPA: PIG-L family deacetylase [Streptosporangiaceae bacterium]